MVGEGEAEDDGVDGDGDYEDALLPKEMPIIAPTTIRGKTIATEVNCGQSSMSTSKAYSTSKRVIVLGGRLSNVHTASNETSQMTASRSKHATNLKELENPEN